MVKVLSTGERMYVHQENLELVKASVK
jgi:hypothetical protein